MTQPHKITAINSGSNTIETIPEFIRLPASGQRCPHTGLSRSSLNELCVPGVINDYNPKVKSTLLKKRNAQRGIRLINYDSLMTFLNSAEEGVIVS